MDPVIVASLAAAISALAALVAIGLSIHVHKQTQKQLRPTARPIVSLFDNKGQAVLLPQVVGKPREVGITILLMFKNIGRHPLSDLRIEVGASPQSNLSQFRQIEDTTVANTLDTDNVFNWSFKIAQPAIMKGNQAKVESEDVFVYMRLSYKDGYESQDNYYSEYWLTYKTGMEGVAHATIAQQQVFEPFVRKVFKAIPK